MQQIKVRTCNKIKYTKRMEHPIAERNAKNIVQLLLQTVETEVKKKKLISNLPIFLLADFGRLINETMIGSAMEADTRGINCKAEELASIPKIQKDTLMPKDLSEQKVRVNSPNRQCQSPRSSCSSIKKGVGLSRRSSIKLQDKLKSISFAEPSYKKKPSKVLNSTCNRLDLENGEEDAQVDQMRQKIEVRLKYLEEEKKFKSDREKHHQDRLQQFNEVAGGHENQYTFDYDGDAMRRTMYEGKLKLNSVRAGMGSTSKKLKEGFSKINTPEQFRVDSATKRPKQKQDNFRTIKQLQMPFFPMKHAEPHDVKNLKLQEYRKFYGKKYSRMGSNTIQVIERARTSRDDLLGEKKHMKEEKMPSMTQTNFGHQSNSRRLALPKLHGKYKVLDRYED